MGVSAIRRVRGRGGHRASRSGRRASNASKSQTKTARSRSIWDDVPLGERVEGSPSRRPVRVRDAVQVALDARQERRGVRGVAHRARPARRAIPIYRTDECARSENDFCDCRSCALHCCTRARCAVVPFPSFRERPPISEKGEKRRRGRSLTVDPLLGARSTRGRIAARARRARFGPRRDRLRSAVSTRRTVAVFRVWRNGGRDDVGGRDVRFGRGR